ncbi:MAG: type II toxin-antitoxin system prevent-host-death family antitoxin [Verrucomicrobia bacterium]|nr:type II toxin-antitoxin system prevent-host-death family antitoxin [Verrucomicrobiota bacterium]
MKTATARELKHGLSAILDLVEHGESICIKRHGHVIARLVPEKKVSRSFIGGNAGGPPLPDTFNEPTEEPQW